MGQSPLWKHQEESIDFVMSHRAAGVFSGMGSGKTRVAVEVVKRLDQQLILVVCPKAALEDGVWSQNFEQYFGRAYGYLGLTGKATVHQKTNLMNSKIAEYRELGIPLVICMNYDIVWRTPLKSFIMKHKWDCVILDEGHRIKSAGSTVSKFFAGLGKKTNARKLALTGTPTPNSPLDVYGLYRFLASDIFGTNFDNFKHQYADFGGFNGYQVLRFKNLDDLGQKMGTIAIRFRTEDVLDLPPISHIKRFCDLGPNARRAYNDLNNEFITQIGDGEITASNILVKSLRLQQIASGYAKMDDRDQPIEIDTAKRVLLEEVIEELPHEISEEGLVLEPLVVFCKFTADIKGAIEVLRKKGYKVGEISGRAKHLEPWRTGAINALVIQIDAGSESIDLTRASYAVYYSHTYHLGTFEQSQARLHRPGQTKPTRFIHLIARDTIDEVIYQALTKKARINDYLYAVYQRISYE